MPASFDTSRVGLGGYTSDQSFLQRLWYGNLNLEDGTPIDTTQFALNAQRTAAGWNEKHPSEVYIPLAPPIPDSFIQKAIFHTGTDAEQSPAEYRKAVAPMVDEIEKAQKKYAEELIQKAETTSSNLMHVIADQGVAYLYKRPYPVQALIPAEGNRGKTANWDAIGPFDFGSANFGVEDPSLTESNLTTYNRSSNIKYMYAVGRVTKAAQLAGVAQYPARDMLAIRIDSAQDSLRALRERAILGVTRDVTSTTNAFTNAGANEYAGLYYLITNNTGAPNWYDVSALAVNTYDEIMEALDITYNRMVVDAMQPNLAICDYNTFGVIRRGLMEYFRTEPVKEFVQGVSKISLVFPNEDGLPLIPSPFMPQAAGTNGNIMLVDTRLLARRVLWQDTYEELAKINTSQKFVISAAETFIDKSDTNATNSLQGGVMGITLV